ncbi:MULTISPECIES: hypothetical protein [Streptomyces]|uniref:hypothetical protein n=1 Tax=Streptomyces TaxID=1883 RepID=UPI0018859CDA|nr:MULTISPECIES: hypothetical protein [Streptomyces]MCX5035184.1 hypothetical protein [Streptomyces coelicoflavus]
MDASGPVPIGPAEYRKPAEEGNRIFQSILGKWLLERGHAREALKWLTPLSGRGFNVEPAIAEAWELLAKDPQYAAEAERSTEHLRTQYPAAIVAWLSDRGRIDEVPEWLIPLAETGACVRLAADTLALLARTDSRYEAEAERWARAVGDSGVIRLAREMWSWQSGREAEAKNLLAHLARDGSGPAAAELAKWERSDSIAAIGWHCHAIDLGFTQDWSDLEEVLRDMKSVNDADRSLMVRARAALETAQAAERAKVVAERARQADSVWEFRRPQGAARVSEAVAVAVAAAAAVPFVQTVASQAASDAYAKAKQLFSRVLRRDAEELTERHSGPTRYVWSVTASPTPGWSCRGTLPTRRCACSLKQTWRPSPHLILRGALSPSTGTAESGGVESNDADEGPGGANNG